MKASCLRVIIVLLGIALPIGALSQANAEPNLNVDGARIIAADSEAGNWLSNGRTYDEQRFSPLENINAENAGELGLAWSVLTEVGRGHEASPIVVDGNMYVTLPWSKVLALRCWP